MNLEKKLGLIEQSPIEIAYSNPIAENLKKVPKNEHTIELLLHICKHDGLALQHASKRLVTNELCEISVKQNGLSLKYIPEKIIKTSKKNWLMRLYMTAVFQNGNALEFVPEEFLKNNKNLLEKAICFIVEGNENEEQTSDITKYPIAFVPNDMLSEELLYKAVKYNPLCLRDIDCEKITRQMVCIAVANNGLSLKYVPQKLITKKIVDLAIADNVRSIRYVPKKYINEELCEYCFQCDRSVLPYIEEKYVTESMCLQVIKEKIFSVSELRDIKISFNDLPEKMRNNFKIINAILDSEENAVVSLTLWNERIINNKLRVSTVPVDKRNKEIKPLQKKTIKYLNKKLKSSGIEENDSNGVGLLFEKYIDFVDYVKKAKCQVDNIPSDYSVVPHNEEIVLHNYLDDVEGEKIYYISDIHIEHQLFEEIIELLLSSISSKEKYNKMLFLIDQKIDEMIYGADVNSILLIGGDVADNIGLSKMFFDRLWSKWNGKVICILGNHELWDGTHLSEWIDPYFHSRSIEEIVKKKKKTINKNIPWLIKERVLIENELYVIYKNEKSRTVCEKDIMNTPDDELSDFLEKCSLIVLGGLGYSGLNPKYNANAGLYRRAITSMEEDIKRTETFRKVYEKIKRCAYNKKIVVLTHTPVYDWINGACNPNWIYVNGHTHCNAIMKTESIVLSDNQMGYKPRRWKLNAFTIGNMWYDPFEKYNDGIYEIDSEKYKEFNIGRGIYISGCNHKGKLYLLKASGNYMFVLESPTSLCLMNGGSRKKLEKKDIQYYYNNMVPYVKKIESRIKPYQEMLKRISEEVKKIGGLGNIHGCIVDISFFSHLYLNPLDGKITPYWAIDTLSRLVFGDVQKLIKEKEPCLLKCFKAIYKNGDIPIIGNSVDEKNDCFESIIIPQWMFGTEMYCPSRMMRSVQYIWEQNVIRIWNDAVLNDRSLTEKPKMINSEKN